MLKKKSYDNLKEGLTYIKFVLHEDTREVKELLFEGRGVEVAANLCNFVTAQTRNSCQETFKRMYEEYRQRFVK